MVQKESQRGAEAEIPTLINTIYEEKLKFFPKEKEQNLRGESL